MTHKEISAKMECSISLIKSISCGRRRQIPTRFKRVLAEDAVCAFSNAPPRVRA
jgi:hypothetical protein